MGSMTARRSSTLSLGGPSRQVTKTLVVADGKRQTSTITIPDGSTDLNVDVAFALAALRGYILHSDRALTIETNDGTTPDDSIAMAADQERSWMQGDDEIENLFTEDVTSLKVTNASGEDAELFYEFLTDGTP